MKYNLILLACGLLMAFRMPLTGQVKPVEIVLQPDGSWEMIRDGAPYWIEGAGTSNPGRLAELARRGGNSIRTWGTDASTAALLDSAEQYGISVMLGLWVGRESDGFDYNNEQAIASQLSRFTDWVLEYKDHPALLAWGIGNEVNIGYSNLKVWDAINDISRMIHELDGNHPTLTVTAGISTTLANTIHEKADDLDLLGVNSYGGLTNVGNTLSNSNWVKPYVVTEWGINGPWETGKSAWDAPFEPNSTAKAETFSQRYQHLILPNKGKLLGSYAFLWNEKFESTYTWFGLFVHDETTPMIDALQSVWTDTTDHNLAPIITGHRFAGQGQKNSYLVLFSKDNLLEIDAFDPEGDALSYEFIIRPEKGENGVIPMPWASYDGIPGIIDHTSGPVAELSFNSMEDKTNYRIYMLVRDGRGHVATATIPIRTGLIDLVEEYEFAPEQDAYVRNGAYQELTYGTTDPEKLLVRRSAATNEQEESYLLFDLSQAPPEFTRVELELYGQSENAVLLELWGFGEHHWNEDLISWRNRIIPGSGVLATYQALAGETGLFHWEMTDFIQKQFSQKNRVITFVIRGEENQTSESVVFNSKEAQGGQAPRLVFYTGDVAIESVPMEKCMLYPNPVSDQLQLNLPAAVSASLDGQVFSMEGYVLQKHLKMSPNSTISVADWPCGSYLISLKDASNGYRCNEIVVKR